MTRLALVADDLTGALDSAAAFCGRFGAIPVHLGLPGADVGGHVAVDLATRDADAATAVRRAADAAPLLAQADIAFKKIDSRLRGPWAAELDATLRGGAFALCALAPAFPGQGRATVDGRQHVIASDGTTRVETIDPAQVLRELGVPVVAVRAGDAAWAVQSAVPGVPGRAPVLLFDASTDAALREIVRATTTHAAGAGAILWCGAAGLAQALASADTPRVDARVSPTLAIVGTDHPVSREQAARAIAAGVPHHAMTEAAVADATRIVARHLDVGEDVLLTFDLEPGLDAASASRRIARGLQALLPTLPRPALLVATGGETLLSICAAVGARELDVVGEASPGLPRSRLRDGAWAGLPVLSKSGGFGPPDWLAALLRSSAATGR